MRTQEQIPHFPDTLFSKGLWIPLRSRRQTLEASWNFNTAGFLSESDSKCYLNMSISYACACTQRCSVSTRTFPANVSGMSSKNLNQASDEKRDLAGQWFPPPLFLTPLFKALSRKIGTLQVKSTAIGIRVKVTPLRLRQKWMHHHWRNYGIILHIITDIAHSIVRLL